MTRLSIHIETASVRWKNSFPRMKDKIARAAQTAFDGAKKPAAFSRRAFEVSIILTTDARIRVLNRDYLGKDKPTNVLSFPQFTFAPRFVLDSREKGILPLGDVVLAHETIKRECRAQGKSMEAHVTHLVVHGILHLLGYDHMRLKDAKNMEKLECDILAGLGYADPYHDAKTKSGGANGRRA